MFFFFYLCLLKNVYNKVFFVKEFMFSEFFVYIMLGVFERIIKSYFRKEKYIM